MKDRIITNWKTTAVGMAIILFGGVLFVLNRITWVEFTACVTIASPFIIMKDPK